MKTLVKTPRFLGAKRAFRENSPFFLGLNGRSGENNPFLGAKRAFEVKTTRFWVHPLNAWTCAPKGHKPIAQGIALGGYWVFTTRPVKGKSIEQKVVALLALASGKAESRARCSIATIPKAMPGAMCLQGLQPFQPFYISSMHLTDEPEYRSQCEGVFMIKTRFLMFMMNI